MYLPHPHMSRTDVILTVISGVVEAALIVTFARRWFRV